MTITRTGVDDLNITLTIKIDQPDYEESVAKALKEYRRKAQVQGFRAGNAPMALVQKMYGRSILYDEVLKLLDKSISDYIRSNQLHVLGEPIPSEDSPRADFSTPCNYEFKYDFALRPSVEVNLKELCMPYYTLEITDNDKQNRMDSYRREFGTIVDLEMVDGSDFLLFVDATQSAESGISIENSMLSAQTMTAQQQAMLHDKKIGEPFEINIRELLTNDTDCAAFLKITKEKLSEIPPILTITIRRIVRNIPAEINQELFDKTYGQGVVQSEADYLERIADELRAAANYSSDLLFARQARTLLMENTKIPMPETTLKRWLKLSADKDGKPLTTEELEQQAAGLFNTLRWRLIVERIAEQNSIVVSEADIRQQIAAIVRRRMMSYGLYNLSDTEISEYVDRHMEDKNARFQAEESALTYKVVESLKTLAQINTKTISREEFNKIMNG